MLFNNEKEVEFFYWTQLERVGKSFDKNFRISAADKTDGYLDFGSIKALCEIKYDLDFSNNFNIARVIIQALYYIKQRQNKGLEAPQSIFIGDSDEYFLVSVKQFAEYLDSEYVNEMDPGWNIAPSSAYKSNTKLYMELAGKTIPLMIKKLDDEHDFDAKFVSTRLVALAQNTDIKTKLDAETIKKPFHYFTQSVLLNSENIKDHPKIKLFFAVITGDEDAVYTKGKLRYEGKDYPVHDGYYAGFVNIYQTKYKASERESFIGSMDSLIKEEARRFHGAYFTPKVIVDYAHEVITKNLGENWKEEYVVWDPAAGTLNLTRDYQFRELYCSTLFQEELDLASDYNPESNKFQFDFLNDEFKAIRDGGKVPDGLYDAVNDKDKKVMVLMNPPYANTGSGFGGFNSKGQKLLGKNIDGNDKLKEEMKKAGYGMAAKNLYNKFIFLALKYGDKMAAFTPTGFLRNVTSFNVRKYLSSFTKMITSFSFDSKYFDGAAGGWPIMFSIWTQEEISEEYFSEFVEFINGKKKSIKTKEFYSAPQSYAGKLNSLNKKNSTNVSSKLALSMPCTLKDIRTDWKLPKDYLGSAPLTHFVGEGTHVGIYTAPYSNKGTPRLNITKSTLFDATLFSSVRTLIKNDWFNETDLILEGSPTEEFKYDSLIHFLFQTRSYQSSLRKVGYDTQGNPINYPTAAKKGTINVYNEWFFLSNQEMQDLADGVFSELYYDAKGQKDRYVYNEIEKLIADNKLSQEALDVLEAGRNLFRDTMTNRQSLHTQYPEYHLNAWDAGFWQLRTALKKAGLESMLDDLNEKYKKLEDKMRPLVYELGFLKQ